MNARREEIRKAKRWVVKIGSALMTENGCGLKPDVVKNWADQILRLREKGIELVVVSSGAVAAGVTTLGWQKRPTVLSELQAAAAVGQMGLVQVWDSCFKPHNIATAQVLLTHEDIADRSRYLNARSTLRRLVDLGVLTIINENDTVSTKEIQFGDNDTLAGLVANLIEADVLVLLTDQDGLFDQDPRQNKNANLIPEAKAGDANLNQYAGKGGALGRGGMLSKLKAAESAAKSGATTIIANGTAEDVLLKIADGEAVGSLLYSEQAPLAARKQWLASHSQINGYFILDDGAVRVLKEEGKSLLAVGVQEIKGDFSRGEIIACLDNHGAEVARGLANYDSVSSRKIKGRPSKLFEEILGFMDEPELIHRDNLIIL